MSILSQVGAGAACGGAIGLALGNNAVGNPANFPGRGALVAYLGGCTGIGAVAGAAFGGALGVARRIGPVAIGVVLGGTAGFVVGAPICALLAGMAGGAPGATTVGVLCTFGMCVSVPVAAGSLMGAVCGKISNVAQQAFYTNIIRPEVERAINQQREFAAL